MIVTRRSTSDKPSFQSNTFMRANRLTKIEKRQRIPRIVITTFWEEKRRMMKQKAAAMITPLTLSSWIDFWVGIQPQASTDVWKTDLAVTGSFDCQMRVKFYHLSNSISFKLILSSFVTLERADICMKAILSSTTPTFCWSLAILPVSVVLSHWRK